MLERKSKWRIEGYDRRPCPDIRDEGLLAGQISGIYAQYAENLRLHRVRVEAEEEMLPFYREKVTLKHVGLSE